MHTPGPWNIEEDSMRDELSIGHNRVSVGRREIALVGVGYEEDIDQEQRANARLIAAAPELLEALQTLVTFSDFNDEESHATFVRQLDGARAAIAKATVR